MWAFEGKIMNISKDQIVQLLESQGNHDQAQQAGQQLPDQVDTDNGNHVQLLSKLGIDPGMLGGLGKLL
jgi:predicted heme/steroid binding protein